MASANKREPMPLLWSTELSWQCRVAPMLTPRVEFGLMRLANDNAIAFGGAFNSSNAQLLGSNSSEIYRPAVSLNNVQVVNTPTGAPSNALPNVLMQFCLSRQAICFRDRCLMSSCSSSLCRQATCLRVRRELTMSVLQVLGAPENLRP